MSAVRKWFPLEAGDTPQRPEAVEADRRSGLKWKNHCFSVHVMVMELHALATGKPLLPMVLGHIKEKKKNRMKNNK